MNSFTLAGIVSDGDHVRIEGTLSSWNGYLKAKIETIAEIEEADPIAAARNLDGESLCTVGPDGELPF